MKHSGKHGWKIPGTLLLAVALVSLGLSLYTLWNRLISLRHGELIALTIGDRRRPTARYGTRSRMGNPLMMGVRGRGGRYSRSMRTMVARVTCTRRTGNP